MTIEEINALSPQDFISVLGGLYEHSPWIAEAAESSRPFEDFQALFSVMEEIVKSSGEARQLALLRAHPELAGKAVLDATLTEASMQEQASAGLDRMTPQEFAEFHGLNAAYRARFDFPFIICVRLTDKPGILRALDVRGRNTREQEFRTALEEVSKIVSLRLEAMRS